MQKFRSTAKFLSNSPSNLSFEEHPVRPTPEQLYNHLRSAKIEGLNVYRKDQYPKHFHYGKGESELLLPILLTADKGYWIDKVREVIFIGVSLIVHR